MERVFLGCLFSHRGRDLIKLQTLLGLWLTLRKDGS